MPPPSPDFSQPVNVEEFLKTVDTTLTDEQRAYIETIKRKIKGGKNQPRSVYRDVGTQEERDREDLENNGKRCE